MGKTVAYMRISTKEERGRQKFDRQERALDRWCKENGVEISERRIYRDDESGKSFDRKAWKELEADIQEGDTIVFKDICRFTREYENGFRKYMELMEKGIRLVFLDNTVISTDYIRAMMHVAERQPNRIARKSLEDTIELLLLVELDRAEQERELIVKRIRDGMAASPKKPGRPRGKLDKMSGGLREDIRRYLSDRSIRLSDLMKRYGISRNTLKKYIGVVEAEDGGEPGTAVAWGKDPQERRQDGRIIWSREHGKGETDNGDREGAGQPYNGVPAHPEVWDKGSQLFPVQPDGCGDHCTEGQAEGGLR